MVIYEIEYDGKYFESQRQLADYLGIRRETLSKRIRLGWAQEYWGEPINNAKVSTGYYWENVPDNLKELSKKLSIVLNITQVEAYQLLLREIGNAL